MTRDLPLNVYGHIAGLADPRTRVRMHAASRAAAARISTPPAPRPPTRTYAKLLRLIARAERGVEDERAQGEDARYERYLLRQLLQAKELYDRSLQTGQRVVNTYNLPDMMLEPRMGREEFLRDVVAEMTEMMWSQVALGPPAPRAALAFHRQTTSPANLSRRAAQTARFTALERTHWWRDQRRDPQERRDARVARREERRWS